MELDKDIEQKGTTRRRRYDFNRVTPGTSAWVKTSADRVRMLAAFKYWVSTNKEDRIRLNAYAVSEKVGEDDPRGEGYRVFFKSKEKVAVIPEAKNVDI